MTNQRLEPTPWTAHYLVLRALAAQLRAQAVRRIGDRRDLAILDVGCGSRPYEPIFTPYAQRYVGLDPVDGPGVDVIAPAESIPFPDATFDCVVSTQVLEHVEGPAEAVSEMRRVLRPGGIAFVSTHGTNRYHPGPNDYWRWTHAGLFRLFSTTGEWDSIDVYPNGGNGTTLGYLLGQQVGSALRGAKVGVLRPPVQLFLNVVARAGDRLQNRLLPDRRPDLVANYLVVAVAPEQGTRNDAGP